MMLKHWSVKEIEDKKAQQDIGVMLYRIYEGASSEGANWIEAYLVVAAYMHGMFKSTQDLNEEEGGDT